MRVSLDIPNCICNYTYDHEIRVPKMVFPWRVDGTILQVKLSAPTTGWIGIGSNPSIQMRDAKFIVGLKTGKQCSLMNLVPERYRA
jgi:hypothetical protein